MSDYGLVQQVFADPKGSALSAAASASDTVLYVDDAQDFNDEGGILDLNGTRLQYTSLVEGENPGDPDEINLADPLAVAADLDDAVSPVVGGFIPEDWYAVVTMGEAGDVAHVPLDVDQRNQWPIGEYPDPVPVIVSDDLQHLEDAPGRTVSSRNAFLNTDEYTYDGIAATIELPLTKTPISGSEQPFWKAATVAVGGVGLPPGSWRIELPNLIVDDPDLMAEFEADDLFWVHYAYDAAADDISRPVEPTPLTVGTVGDFASPLPPGFLNSVDSLWLALDQPGFDVYASKTGTLTSFTIGLDEAFYGAGTHNRTVYAVTGSVSGTNFTVTGVSSALSFVDSDLVPNQYPQTVTCSVPINQGDYLGLLTTGVAQLVGKTTGVTGAALGYAVPITSVPNPGDVIAFTSYPDELLAIQGT